MTQYMFIKACIVVPRQQWLVFFKINMIKIEMIIYGWKWKQTQEELEFFSSFKEVWYNKNLLMKFL